MQLTRKANEKLLQERFSDGGRQLWIGRSVELQIQIQANGRVLQNQFIVVPVRAIRFAPIRVEKPSRVTNDVFALARGGLFNGEIEFVMKPLNFITLFTDAENKLVDYIYVNPSAYGVRQIDIGLDGNGVPVRSSVAILFRDLFTVLLDVPY